MGKISDAIKRYREEQEKPVHIIKSPEVVADEHTESRENLPGIAQTEIASDHREEQQTITHTTPASPVAVSDEPSKSPDTALDKADDHLAPHNIEKSMITLHKPQSFEAEQFKILRTKILFPSSGEPARTIMVTSTAPGEGKSFIAANLAVSIAQNISEHVLIIDCDMRVPSIHKQFGFDNVPGLSEYLSNEEPLSALLLKTNINKLSVLPGGKPPPNPAELMSSQRMFQLLREVKERYTDRYIIIDTPPPQLAAEANALSRQVDGILIVVKYGSTPRALVSDLIELVGKEKILGIVFNKINMGLTNLLSYKKYGKYYTKYHK